MIALLVVLLCILSAFVAALWDLWQLVDGLCWVCQRNVAALVPDAPPTPHQDVPLPAWLERNEAGEGRRRGQ